MTKRILILILAIVAIIDIPYYIGIYSVGKTSNAEMFEYWFCGIFIIGFCCVVIIGAVCAVVFISAFFNDLWKWIKTGKY